MGEWRTIESAPRGCELILAWGDRAGIWMVYWNGSSWDDGDYRSNVTGLTHWMPLPAPPTAADDQEAR